MSIKLSLKKQKKIIDNGNKLLNEKCLLGRNLTAFLGMCEAALTTIEFGTEIRHCNRGNVIIILDVNYHRTLAKNFHDSNVLFPRTSK